MQTKVFDALGLNKYKTDKTTLTCEHGRKLHKTILSSFSRNDSITLDCDGIESFTEDFFQELILPLVAEYGSDRIKSSLFFMNFNRGAADVIRSAIQNSCGIFARNHRQITSDVDLYDINISVLIKARELCRTSPGDARTIFGMDEDTISIISCASFADIQEIADAGVLSFSVRLSKQYLSKASEVGPDYLDSLLVMSGMAWKDD